MPQPLQEIHGIFRIGANSILLRKEHAAGIGLVVTEWNALEYQLIQLFSYVMYANEPTDAGKTTAELAWSNVDSLKARLDLLSSIVLLRLPKLAPRFAALLPEVRKRATERNRVAHGKWFVHEDVADIILLDADRTFSTYSVKDFDEIARRIRGTLHRLHEFLTLAHAHVLVS